MPLSKQSMTIPFLTAIEKTMTAKTKTAKTKALRANLLLSKLPAIELDMRRLTNGLFVWLALISLLLSSVLLPSTAKAQVETAAQPGLQVESRDGTLHLQWQGGVQAASLGELTSYNGYMLPLQTLLVELSDGQAAEGAVASIAVQGVSSSPYTGELIPAPQHTPPALDYVPTPLNTPHFEAKLPDSPIFVMAEGTQRGQRLAVLGFSPIYQDPNSGEILAVDSVAASVAGANVVSSDALLNIATADPNNNELFAPVPALADATGPTNPLANVNALKLFVSNVGIQQISGKDVADGGLSRTAKKLRLFYQGVEVPLHIIDNNSNGTLDDNDYIRFYAHAAGDALNAESVYWLSSGSADGARMSSRSVAAAGAAARNTAYEVGVLYNPTIYETTLAGPDGDNWFQANLRAEGSDAKWDATFPHQLPLNDALPVQLTVNGTAYSIGAYGSNINHRLRFRSGGYSAIHEWVVPAFLSMTPFQDSARNVTLTAASDTWSIELLQEASGRAVMIDAINYLLPVRLNFGGKGAIFQGVNGQWRYQLSGTPTTVTGGRALYDITNPASPQILSIPGGANFEIEDGPEARRYILTGEGTFFTPTIQKNKRVNLGGSGGAHTIYIAPAEFHATLQPLVDLRTSQGYQVRVIDVQGIYDSWSYGMVDPKAIRSFLRFAVGNWSPAPIAAVLVGDGTSDPLNYTGNKNPNVIPAYIDNVDPWLKYVPCESCYGQLDGDTPAQDYLVDIWIGRFPVIDVIELNTVVNKIVRYEQDPDKRALWRSTSVQLADDDVRPDNTIDSAGPFVHSAETIIGLMPASIRQLRNYFMAATDLKVASTYVVDKNKSLTLLDVINDVLNKARDPFVSNADAALQRSIDLMNSGAGIVTYTGHSNHWQWARIVADGEENKWLFGLIEVRSLFNINMPFIAMSMTCYTSQFTEPAPLHWTLDERLFLHGNGGAISTWGPTGFSIVPAHDVMQEGFHQLLWKSPAQQAKMGALTHAGYQHVFASGKNLDVNKSYAVFGDPLTSARIAPIDALFMPKLGR